MSMFHRKISQLIIFFALQIKGVSSTTLKGSSQYAVPGKPYTLICSVPDKTVLAQFLRTAVSPSTTPTVVGGVQVSRSGDCYNVAVSTPVVCDPAVCSCVSDGAGKASKFSWIFTPDNSMDHSTWYCVDFSIKESPRFTLQFAVPVTGVALHNPPALGSDLTVSEGTSTGLVCVTSACRPSANVLWYIGGTNYTSSSSQTVSDETGNLHITTSTLTLNPNRNMNGEKINCSAYNYGDNIVTAKSRPVLNVLYPSENKATTNVSTVSIKKGQEVYILCEVKGGNPKAQLAWNCFGGTTSDVSTGTDSRSVITVVGNSNQDGQPCICRGQHNLATITPAQVTFNIVVAPEKVRLSTTGYIKVTEGAHVPNVTCSAHCSPTCNYMWSRLNGGDTIPGSTLNLGNVTKNMAGTYICTASNQYGNAVSGNLVVIVNYGAGQTIAFNPESRNYTVAENTTIQPILCSASCNPVCDISWDKIGGEGLQNPLILGTIDKSKAGFYICRASNVIKSINKLLTISIKGEDGYEDKRHIDGTTDDNTERPNTASIVLFVLSTLILGVAVTFSLVFYIRYVRQTTINTEQGSASRAPTNEYADVQTVTEKAGKETTLQMTSVYQTLSKRDEPSHYDELAN